MKCNVCRSPLHFFLSKKFESYGLDNVEYWQCAECGFTISRTHQELQQDEWERINRDYHASYQGGDSNLDDPRWIERLERQADVIRDARETGLLSSRGRWVDYGCGDGKLSDLLCHRYNIDLLKYDKHMSRESDYLADSDLVKKTFDFVITTSVFEHILHMDQLDSIEALVSTTGAFGVHTVVCERIPCDSSWFYFLPVHVAFYTNRSMEILMKKWGYESSVYNVESRLWIFFKKGSDDIERIIADSNARQDKPHYIFKHGFVDYWR